MQSEEFVRRQSDIFIYERLIMARLSFDLAPVRPAIDQLALASITREMIPAPHREQFFRIAAHCNTEIFKTPLVFVLPPFTLLLLSVDCYAPQASLCSFSPHLFIESTQRNRHAHTPRAGGRVSRELVR